MDMNEIMKLIQAVSDYGLTSFELEEGNMKIALKREKETVVLSNVPAAGADSAESAPVLSVAQTASAPAPAPQPAASSAETSNIQSTSDNVVISPLVGTFYSSSSPDAEPFVKVGDTVKKGQVLGIIEAMKLMNEIESDFDGVVEAILVKNEDVVEYGQPLFRIR